MSGWKKHLVAGLILSVTFASCMKFFLGWYASTAVLAIFIAAVSTLVPDLDHPMGKLHKIIMTIGFVVAAVGIGYMLLEVDIDYIRIIICGVVEVGVV